MVGGSEISKRVVDVNCERSLMLTFLYLEIGCNRFIKNISIVNIFRYA